MIIDGEPKGRMGSTIIGHNPSLSSPVITAPKARPTVRDHCRREKRNPINGCVFVLWTAIDGFQEMFSLYTMVIGRHVKANLVYRRHLFLMISFFFFIVATVLLFICGHIKEKRSDHKMVVPSFFLWPIPFSGHKEEKIGTTSSSVLSSLNWAGLCPGPIRKKERKKEEVYRKKKRRLMNLPSFFF